MEWQVGLWPRSAEVHHMWHCRVARQCCSWEARIACTRTFHHLNYTNYKRHVFTLDSPISLRLNTVWQLPLFCLFKASRITQVFCSEDLVVDVRKLLDDERRAVDSFGMVKIIEVWAKFLALAHRVLMQNVLVITYFSRMRTRPGNWKRGSKWASWILLNQYLAVFYAPLIRLCFIPHWNFCFCMSTLLFGR